MDGLPCGSRRESDLTWLPPMGAFLAIFVVSLVLVWAHRGGREPGGEPGADEGTGPIASAGSGSQGKSAGNARARPVEPARPPEGQPAEVASGVAAGGLPRGEPRDLPRGEPRTPSAAQPTAETPVPGGGHPLPGDAPAPGTPAPSAPPDSTPDGMPVRMASLGDNCYAVDPPREMFPDNPPREERRVVIPLRGSDLTAAQGIDLKLPEGTLEGMPGSRLDVLRADGGLALHLSYKDDMGMQREVDLARLAIGREGLLWTWSKLDCGVAATLNRERWQSLVMLLRQSVFDLPGSIRIQLAKPSEYRLQLGKETARLDGSWERFDPQLVLVTAPAGWNAVEEARKLGLAHATLESAAFQLTLERKGGGTNLASNWSSACSERERAVSGLEDALKKQGKEIEDKKKAATNLGTWIEDKRKRQKGQFESLEKNIEQAKSEVQEFDTQIADKQFEVACATGSKKEKLQEELECLMQKQKRAKATVAEHEREMGRLDEPIVTKRKEKETLEKEIESLEEKCKESGQQRTDARDILEALKGIQGFRIHVVAKASGTVLAVVDMTR